MKAKSQWKLLTMLFWLAAIQMPAQGPVPAKLRETLRGTGAAAALIDVHSGTVESAYGSADTPAAPGSTLKPLLLLDALQNGVIREGDTVHCSGVLTVGGHNLACVHPRDITVLDARLALADSCNTYFASVAQRMNAAGLVAALRDYGLTPVQPATPDRRILLTLGLEGIQVTPRQLGLAYRILAQKLERGGEGSAAVLDGLVQSVNLGVAHGAHVEGMLLAGKTGTAPNRGAPRDHGWFAGIVYTMEAGKETPAQVLVVYVPDGNGNDAALLARRFLLSYHRGHP